jgi:hypothetical protein
MCSAVTDHPSEKTLEIIRLYCNEKKSTTQIATLTGVPASTVARKLAVAGVELRSRADGIRLRGPDLSARRAGVVRPPFSQEWKDNIREGRLRWSEANAVGTRINTNGYVEYTVGPNKGRSVHDVMMEERIGRRLREDEIVHHVDEDKQHNDWDNLALMTRVAHARLHARERLLSKQGEEKWLAA